MTYENYFKDMFESIPDYRKIVFLICLLQNNKNLLLEVGFSQHDSNRLNLEFKNILKEQFEEYLEYVENEEEYNFEKLLNK